MTNKLPSHAQTVVIGGGIVGASIAYHLAKAGHTDVVLLEKSALSAGTTWHSAGNMETYRADPLIYEIVRYGAQLFPELEKESGQALGWKNTGRVMFTHVHERMEQFKTIPKLAEVRGIQVDLLDRAGLEQRFPILNTKDILGGLWIPNDGRVNPTDLTTAFARAAKKRGARIVQDCTVTRIKTHNGRAVGVETLLGDIACENVVIAAGLWSSDIAATCGVQLPLYALEHFYLITKEVPEITRDLPMFLAFDDYLYGREEVGGFLFGCLDKNALPIATRDLPNDFSFGLLNEQWGQFEPYMENALKRFPLLENAEIRMFLNGPESFTPDSQMIIGPVTPVKGLLVAAGMSSNGIALSSGVGKLISEWIIDGRPGMDVSRLDVRRFSRCQATEFYMRDRVSEIPSYCVEIHGPGDDFTTARHIRLSPLHDFLAGKQARFKSVCGWERALWVGQTTDQIGSEVIVDGEVQAAQAGALLVDHSSDIKLLISGSGAVEFMTKLTNLKLPLSCGEAKLLPLTDSEGVCHGTAHVIQVVKSQWLMTASTEQATNIRNYISRLAADESAITVRDVSGAYAQIRLTGPERQTLLGPLTAALPTSVLESSSFPCDLPANTLICAARAVIASDANSDFILLPSETAFSVASAIDRSTDGLNIRWGGQFAEDAVRILDRIPCYGRDINSFTDLPLSDFPCFAENGETKFDPALPGSVYRALGGYVSYNFGLENGLEPLLCNNRQVGWLTSSAWLSSTGKSAVLARIEAEFVDENLDVLIGNDRIPLTR